MKNLTYEDYLANPDEVLGQIQLEARRARVEAVSRYLFTPLVQFCGALIAIRGVKLRLDPRVTA